MEFLEYTGKDCGNNFEWTVYKKLQDSKELSRLNADALFYFVYVDLVMLVKSNDLGKSALTLPQTSTLSQHGRRTPNCYEQVVSGISIRGMSIQY